MIVGLVGEYYQDSGIEYRTPFVGLYVMAPCYIQLLSDLERNLMLPLKFVESSKYNEINAKFTDPSKRHPIGRLGEDIEILFIHYRSEDEAKSKWARRVKRIKYENLAVKFAGDKDRCTDELLERFEQLKYQRRIALTRTPHPGLRHVVSCKDYIENGAMMYRRALRHFDLPTWLETGEIRRVTPRVLFNWIQYSFGA